MGGQGRSGQVTWSTAFFALPTCVQDNPKGQAFFSLLQGSSRRGDGLPRPGQRRKKKTKTT